MNGNRAGSDRDSRVVGNAIATNEVGHTVRLTDVAAQLRRRWRVILVTVTVTVAAALVFALIRGSTYTAASVLTVNPVSVQPGSTDHEVNMVTEQAVSTSIEVIQRAQETLESDEDPHDLAERIDVTSPSDSQVLEIEATAGDPEEAAGTANAVAEAYLENRSRSAQENIDQALEKLDKRIATLTEELDALSEDSSTREQQLNEIDDLQSEQSELSTLVVDPGRVVTVAAPPDSPSSFGALLYGAGGLVGGVLLGLGLALVRDRFDPHVHSGDRLAGVLGVPVFDYNKPELTDDVLDQLVVRLGLDNPEGVVTVGLISADRTSWHWVGKQLDKHLGRYGIRVVFAPWQGRGVGDESGLGRLVDHERWKGRAQVVLVGATGESGVARAAWVGRWVDKIMITTWRSTLLSTVRRLSDELDDNGNHADLVVTVRDRKEPHGGEPPVAEDPGAATVQISAAAVQEFAAQERANGNDPNYFWQQPPLPRE